MTSRVRLSVSVLLVLATVAPGAQGPPAATRTFSSPAAYPPDASMLAAFASPLRDLVDRFNDDRSAILRFYTIPGSATRRARMRTFYEAWLNTLGRIDFDALPQEGKVDYVLLRTRIEYETALVGREDRIQREIAPFLPFGPGIIALAEDRQRLDFITADAALKALADVAAQVGDAVSSSQARPASPATAVRAAQEVDALNGALAQWFDFFAGYDPSFTAAVPKPHQALSQSLSAYAAALRDKAAGQPAGSGQSADRAPDAPIAGAPIGREGLVEDLRGEMIAYTPEQLIEIGNREYAWCEAEMKKAAREMGFGDDWKAALEKIKNIHVPRGRQPYLVRDLALQAVAFVKRRDLVTVPALAEDQWRMTMMPPAAMRVNPFFLGGETIQVSYPTDTMSEEDSRMVMRGNGPHLSHATVFHELIPGHSLQGFMSRRYNPHRNVFRTPFLVEGWALYWEFLMWDHGFHATPEDRVGALFWRMHRCARIVFSLNFHLGRWTPEQCVQYLMDHVGHDRFTAEGEVRRSFNGSYSPLYQVGYMMGALQIRSLMREMVDSKRMTLKQFNDAVLRQGEMPIEMMRAALAHRPLTRDYKAGWEFYGQVEPARP